jgi:hypothetical protein
MQRQMTDDSRQPTADTLLNPCLKSQSSNFKSELKPSPIATHSPETKKFNQAKIFIDKILPVRHTPARLTKNNRQRIPTA